MERPMGRLVQINISSGGMPKLAVDQVQVGRDGLEGDWQLNRKYHGGPGRAVCIFSRELYAWLKDEHGIELALGSVGENFTTDGVDIGSWNKGDRFRVGDCEIEITDVRTPCRSLNQWDPKLLKVIQGRSGWVASVAKEGVVKTGDRIERL
jgi:MOSC domain-containing protein YiiM